MRTNTKELIVVVGATGSGKTSLSIKLAQRFNAPIISTDSRQLYRGMPIGTAQPTAEELAAAEHHFIACRNIDEEFNCGAYEQAALERLEELFKDHDRVIAVGGSGLYIKALCEGLDTLPPVSDELRTSLRTRLSEEGLEALTEQLRMLDPAFYEAVDRQNPSRVLRALEVILSSGRPYSEQRQGRSAQRTFKIIKVGIDMERKSLYERINHRVDIMVEQGLEQEARNLFEFRTLNSLQTVGYREFFDYFDGVVSYEEAIELIKRNSRRYAKRQMTWFRRDEQIEWFPSPDAFPSVIEYILSKANA
ncbi:MAG: tRNA (adenosine(37)-N6)-dimethylallyltransferase MiaA [Rikenellaceae bacterium]